MAQQTTPRHTLDDLRILYSYQRILYGTYLPRSAECKSDLSAGKRTELGPHFSHRVLAKKTPNFVKTQLK